MQGHTARPVRSHLLHMVEGGPSARYRRLHEIDSSSGLALGASTYLLKNKNEPLEQEA